MSIKSIQSVFILLVTLTFISNANAGSATAGLTVNTQNREEVRNFFNTIYQASENVAMGWTGGNVSQCISGTTTQAYRDAIALRVNFFRALAGVPAAITFNDTFNLKAQQAALMMSANNTLSHTPPSSWICYTADGAEAAGKSNLSLGNTGVQSIVSQIQDDGATNSGVGHRRWLLYPQTQLMGTGDVAGDKPTSALWVIDTANANNPRPTTRDDFVSFPPRGFVPYQLVFQRWSLSYPDADFSKATVMLQRQGVNVPVQLETVSNGFGENTLVWIVDKSLLNQPSTDVIYTVNVNNVSIGGSPRNFNYTVTVFDPMQRGADSVTPTMTGNDQPVINQGNTYTFTTVPNATGYQWLQANRSSFTLVEGAETGLGHFTSTVSAGYNVIATDIKASGSASFHLAQPQPPTNQILTLNHVLSPTSTAQLQFSSRLGLASPQQIAKVQISTDNGQTWQDVFSQAGTASGSTSTFGESDFSVKTVSLAQFAGNTIQVRFNYIYTGQGTYYPQTSAKVGWYIDDISFTGVDELTNQVITDISSNSFTFTPSQAGDYVLQARAQLYGKYPLEWGTAKLVTVQQNSPTQTLPTLGNAMVFSATGNLATANTQFTGGISINNGVYQQKATQKATDSVDIKGMITVDPKHVGQTADMLVVAAVTLTGSTQPLFFMLDKTGNVAGWNQNMASLVAFKEKVTLAANQSVPIYQGIFGWTGTLRVYFGYRLTDGTVVANSQFIDVAITN